MTLLVGQNGNAWTNTAIDLANSSGNAVYYKNGYVAAASGSMTLAHIFFFDALLTANAVKISVYSGVAAGATLLATSAAISKAAGDKTGAISGNIVAGQSYTLVAQADTGHYNATRNSGSNAFQDNQNTSANFSYTSPPATIPTADVSSNQPEFIVWIEGTSGDLAGDFSLSPLLNRGPGLAGPYNMNSFQAGAFGQFGPPAIIIPHGSNEGGEWRRRKHKLIRPIA